MISLLIVDDHPMVIDGISTMLKDVSWIEIASCKTGASALNYLQCDSPDIILLDLNLPDIEGLELCSTIHTTYKNIKIIGLTSIDEAGIITRFLQNGGSGYLLKNVEREEFLHAIDMVLDGSTYLSRQANDKVMEQFRNTKNIAGTAPALTRREKEILGLLNQGFNGPAIAEKLFLSPFTVETHRRNLMQKMNVHNTQALLYAAANLKLL
ncbi:MAG: response regulator transcription factor [Ginsengibacter sp.]